MVTPLINKASSITKTFFLSKLLKLNPEQNKLFRRYCCLIHNQCPENQDPIVITEEITHIWEQAIDDEHLSDCLELADYFLGFDSQDSNSDRSIYFEEHLQEELEAFIRQTNREQLLLHQKQLALLEESVPSPVNRDEKESPDLSEMFKEIKKAALVFFTEAALEKEVI